MRIENNADVPGDWVEALVRFCVSHFPPHPMSVTVADADPRLFTGGKAWWTGAIEIQTSNKGRYPRTSTHLEEAGPVTVFSWAEEFVFVLAHEIQHVHDYATTGIGTDPKHISPYEAELRAEAKAHEVLGAFRGFVSQRRAA